MTEEQYVRAANLMDAIGSLESTIDAWKSHEIDVAHLDDNLCEEGKADLIAIYQKKLDALKQEFKAI